MQTILQNIEEEHGVKAYFGRWLVQGYPRCILIDVSSSRHRLGGKKEQRMKKNGIND